MNKKIKLMNKKYKLEKFVINLIVKEDKLRK